MKKFTMFVIVLTIGIALYRFGVFCLTPVWYEMGKAK